MLDSLKSILLKELQTGSKIQMSVKGYASPLAKTAYNINLTKRRISSLINYFSQIENGAFKPFLGNNAALTFNFLPFGEYVANQKISDDAAIKNESVYSKAAGMERRIQIEYISIDRNKSAFPLITESQVLNLHPVKISTAILSNFIVKNTSNEKITLIIPSTNLQEYTNEKLFLLPNEKSEISLKYVSKGELGHLSIPFDIMVKGYEGKITLHTNVLVE
jgi:hypothetical protein